MIKRWIRVRIKFATKLHLPWCKNCRYLSGDYPDKYPEPPAQGYLLNYLLNNNGIRRDILGQIH